MEAIHCPLEQNTLTEMMWVACDWWWHLEGTRFHSVVAFAEWESSAVDEEPRVVKMLKLVAKHEPSCSQSKQANLSFLFMVLLWTHLSRANLTDFPAFGIFLLPPLCPKTQVYLFSHQIICWHLFHGRQYAQHGLYGEHDGRALNRQQGIDYQISSCMFVSLDNSLWPLWPSLTK